MSPSTAIFCAPGGVTSTSASSAARIDGGRGVVAVVEDGATADLHELRAMLGRLHACASPSRIEPSPTSSASATRAAAAAFDALCAPDERHVRAPRRRRRHARQVQARRQPRRPAARRRRTPHVGAPSARGPKVSVARQRADVRRERGSSPDRPRRRRLERRRRSRALARATFSSVPSCSRCTPAMLTITADVGPRQLGRVRDLAEAAHAHLDDGVAMPVVQAAQRQRHAEVVVEVAFGLEHRVGARRRRQDRRDHLLGRRLAVRAGDARRP